MALNKDILRTKLIQAFRNPETLSNIETVADAIATAIHEYITEGDVVGFCPSGGGALANGKVV